jgi:hypothetical protein
MIVFLALAAKPTESTTDWLTAIGGVGAFLAAVVLAALAYFQIRAGQAQAREAREQSNAQAQEAREQSNAQAREAREQSNAALTMAEAQSDASLKIAHETREAAERQWQPRVIAHKWSDPKLGTGDDAAPDEMAVGYRLKNEGTGPAFNVEHGVEVGGRVHRWPGQYQAMVAREEQPPMLTATGLPQQVTPLVVGVKKDQWSDDLLYWTRFENLLGERFEVRSPPDLTKPAEFRRLS